MIAHITIILLRYLFLTAEQRKSVDFKTLGGTFRSEIEEIFKNIFIFFEPFSRLECYSKKFYVQF
jgi:hypothetical protein